MVYRIYSEKKSGFDVEARGVFFDLRDNLLISGLSGVRILNRYDVEGIFRAEFELAKNTVFSEPPIDRVYFDLPFVGEPHKIFAAEPLPGQFDQRAASAAECIELLTCRVRPEIRSARVFILLGELSDEDFSRIKAYLINPVESRQADMALPQTLAQDIPAPPPVETLAGFTALENGALSDFCEKYRLAMDSDDLAFCRDYFKNEEKRDPTLTELRMLDTYWSDHCRHTTFTTRLKSIDIRDCGVKKAYDAYTEARQLVYGANERPVTLMDMATIGAKALKRRGLLQALDESEEINACSVKTRITVDGQPRDYLLMFKNETHNHPTEIEPFGGAATCLGGAIRDPLSGRSYVYHAMRITGSGDPRKPVSQTLPGKLPQKKLTTTAAAGFSSYGNQIGLATGFVRELYHEGYVAKRLETGAVVGAVPAENVRRERPQAGDLVILLGGRTGRDGCGGATGSSKSHDKTSLAQCGAEVQKGNPPEERKIQRLFRKKNVSLMIKRCNDFGAGGVSVAVGELADGLEIDLSKVPKKYEGLDGTELAISESQERMAVVVSKNDAAEFIRQAEAENLEATVIAAVTDDRRLKMTWNGDEIVNVSRDFLNSAGAPKFAAAVIKPRDISGIYDVPASGESLRDRWLSVLSDLNICSQKGLVDRFDSTIGAASVTVPFGGKHRLSPAQFMAAKFPVSDGETDDASVMAFGFNPYVSEKSPFLGAVCAVVESLSRIAAAGCDYKEAYLSLQEFFPKTAGDPERWGLPASALLGALYAQLSLGVAAIGGKDSMSGSFENIDVPPTLISFAVSTADASKLVTPELKKAGHRLILIAPEYSGDGLVSFESLARVFKTVRELIERRAVYSSFAVSAGGVCEAVSKMAFGNRIGVCLDGSFDLALLFKRLYGAVLLEVDDDFSLEGTIPVGALIGEPVVRAGGETIKLSELAAAYESPLESVFPTRIKDEKSKLAPLYTYESRPAKTKSAFIALNGLARPRAVIPVFPGTNCEYDSARAFERAGASVETVIINNLSTERLSQSITRLAALIKESQIVMLPGGFSGGDEPEGSAKFICAVFRNERIREAVSQLLDERDGLMLGICNGFQALIKLGLVPFGKIVSPEPDLPTLTFNNIGRHQSLMVTTRVSSVLSPWFAGCEPGELHTVAISHGEGRFIASDELIASMAKNGQIAAQYVTPDGEAASGLPFNPNGSAAAIEAITSPDGRVLGKMAHSERTGRFVAKNAPGAKDQRIFESGVAYFK